MSREEKFIDYLNEKSNAVLQFVQRLHSQIIGEYYDEVQSFSASNDLSINEDMQAKTIENFLNQINEITKTINVNQGNFSPKSIIETFALNVLQDEINNNLRFRNQRKILGWGLFQNINRNKEDKDTWAIYLEKLLPRIFNKAINKSKAIHLGAEKGLPSDLIRKNIVKPLVQDVTKTIQNELKQEFQNNQTNDLFQFIGTKTQVQIVDLKTDFAVMKIDAEVIRNSVYRELLTAISGATFSVKSYQEIEAYSKAENPKFNGFNEGLISLGATGSSVSILPFFLSQRSRNLANEFFPRWVIKRGISEKMLFSLYNAAMHLSSTREYLLDLSWIYDLRGSETVKYSAKNLSGINTLIKESQGIKFFIAIDQITGKIAVRSTKRMVYDLIIQKMNEMQIRGRHFSHINEMNVVDMKYFGWNHEYSGDENAKEAANNRLKKLNIPLIL